MALKHSKPRASIESIDTIWWADSLPGFEFDARVSPRERA